jgi:hypothetical protein
MSESNIPDPHAPETGDPVLEKPAKPIAETTESVRKGIRPRTAKRLAIMAAILVVLVYGFYWFVGLKGDLQLPSDTSGMISAVKQLDQGSQVVVIDAQGKVTDSPDYTTGKSDRDTAWDPLGNRLFFISDRKEDSFHIFRWDPQRGALDQKSIDRAGRSGLSFDVQDKGIGDLVGLVLVRGTVQEFTPKTAKSQQVMPPTKKAVGGADEGASSTFELIYKRFGQSFKAARWFGNQRFIAAVMRREDKGESLIVQDSQPDEKGMTRQPQLVFVAEKINLAVDPTSGSLVFSIAGILPIPGADGTPALGPDGKVPTYPFTHGLFMLSAIDSAPKLEFIGPSPSKDICFGNPVVSPDGTSMMFLIGKYTGEGNMEVTALGSCPLKAGGIQAGGPLATGHVTDPSFSHDGRKIAYVKQDGGHQAIFIASSDGSGAKNLTGSAGDFSSPLFSPQYK